MFTVEERDRVRDRLLEMAREDPRLVAGALVGSTAAGSDRWSDLDVTFGLSDDASVQDVLTDWTSRLEKEFKAVRLFDLPSLSTVYRVFLFPGNLQVDLSFTPGHDFGSRGPNFTLLFGTAVKMDEPPPPSADHLFGLAVHHLVRARICIERGKMWQAEYWISAARDYALSLACQHHGLRTSYGRGFDDLPAQVLEAISETLVRGLGRDQLLHALSRTIDILLSNSQDARNSAIRLEAQLHQLTSTSLA
jgi:hypothetical protein